MVDLFVLRVLATKMSEATPALLHSSLGKGRPICRHTAYPCHLTDAGCCRNHCRILQHEPNGSGRCRRNQPQKSKRHWRVARYKPCCLPRALSPRGNTLCMCDKLFVQGSRGVAAAMSSCTTWQDRSPPEGALRLASLDTTGRKSRPSSLEGQVDSLALSIARPVLLLRRGRAKADVPQFYCHHWKRVPVARSQIAMLRWHIVATRCVQGPLAAAMPHPLPASQPKPMIFLLDSA